MIELYLVPRDRWEGPCGGSDEMTLAKCAQQVAICARQMAKGANVRSGREKLGSMVRIVAETVGRMPIGPCYTAGPGDREWWELLDRLAEQRCKQAKAKARKIHVPRFLPCVFAPPEDQSQSGDPKRSRYYAGPYGVQDVVGHLGELQDPTLSISGEHERVKWFQRAVERDSGIVEIAAREFSSVGEEGTPTTAADSRTPNGVRE